MGRSSRSSSRRGGDDDFSDEEHVPALRAGAEASWSLADAQMSQASAGRQKGSGTRWSCRAVFLTVLFSVTALVAMIRWFDLSHSLYWWRFPVHSSYKLVDRVPLVELGGQYTLRYTHRASGAQVMAILQPKGAPDDKAFGVSFRTVPTDDKGCAHILEHSTLCGSAKYPAKDPFLHLLKSSLQTFLNAMTYPDRTVYVVASRNSADLANLMSVYLDAVFKPRCVTPDAQWVLQQEGWHVTVASEGDYDYDAPGDAAQDQDGEGDPGERRSLLEREELVFKGVVLAEMKGAYSDPEDRLEQLGQGLLFPDTTYQYVSGGAPDAIITLKHDEFVDFYERHYHASNAQLLVSGTSGDIYEALDQAAAYLDSFTTRKDLREATRIPYQAKRYTSTVATSVPYAADDEGDGYMATWSWLLNDKPWDPVTEMAWVVLNMLLLGTDTATLQFALTQSKLGSDVIGGGFSNYLLQSTFGVGLRGIKEQSDVNKVGGLIFATLATIVKDGFHPEEIESAINTVEFLLREENTGDTPRAVDRLLAVLNKWNYDMDPWTALQFEDALSGLKNSIHQSGSKMFQTLIQEYLLDNTHMAMVELVPSSTYAQETEEKEKETLAMLSKELTDDQYESIVEESIALIVLQSTDDSPEDVAAIPTLTLNELDPKETEYDSSLLENAWRTGVTVLNHEVESSSGIAYVDFGMDMSTVSFQDIPLIPFLAQLMTQTGTGSMTDAEFNRFVGMHTGGVYVRDCVLPVRSTNVNDSDGFVASSESYLSSKLFFKGKVTSGKVTKLFDIYNELLNNANLDNQDKAVSLLKETIAELRNDVQGSGHHYARLRIGARYSVHGFIAEQMNGVSQLQAMSEILETAESNWPALLNRLNNMRRAIVGGRREGMVLNLTGDKNVLTSIKSAAITFLTTQLPPQDLSVEKLQDFSASEHPWVGPVLNGMKESAPLIDEAIVVQSQVSYVGKGGNLYLPGDKVPGSAAVVSGFLQTGYLWETVRVKNGAYGAFASLNRDSGTFTMLSYRDPSNIGKTLDAFDGTALDLMAESVTTLQQNDGAAVTNSVIGAIGKMDGSALSPDDVGWISLTRWLRNESPKVRQQWRQEMLDTKLEDFVKFSEQLSLLDSPTVAVVTHQSAVEKAGGIFLKTISLP